MKPTKSNRTSNKCANPIPAGCVIWDDPCDIPGLCPKPSLVDVINHVRESASCCESDFPPGNYSAYTGKWVPFTAIPTTVSSGGATCSVGGLGSLGGVVPQYKWTKEGDLKVRGNLALSFTTVTNTGSFPVKIGNLSPINFPSGWTGNQGKLVTVNYQNTNPQTLTDLKMVYLYVDYPTGDVYISVIYFNPGLITLAIGIDFGCTQFNFA